MELEELRPEFVQEVMNLRSKVLHRVKPKTLNNKALTGEMLAILADSYLQAMNNGVVPNIDSSWSYICRG
jgi:hypothetical protein